MQLAAQRSGWFGAKVRRPYSLPCWATYFRPTWRLLMAAELGPQRDGVDAVQGIDRLLALDDLWTSYLDDAGRDDIVRDLSDLEALVADMNTGLAGARDDVRIAGKQLEKASDEQVTRAIGKLLQDQANDRSGLRERFIDDLAELGVRRSLLVACRYVDWAAEKEMGFLNDKLELLREGKFEPGDIGPRMRCMLELAGIACCAVPCILATPACAGLAGAAILYASAWDSSGCKATLAEAVEYLRAAGAEPA